MTARSTYARILRDNRAFRRLWLADLVSLFGDWFNTIAVYTAVEELLGTSEAIGWVVVAKSLPVLLMSPIAGPLADRLSRRSLMIGADFARAILGLVLIVAWEAGSVSGIYACTVLQICASGVFLPAKNAAVPDLVGYVDLAAANALSGATWSIALAFGAAAGGMVTHWFGIETAFVLDALTFLLSAWLLRDLPSLRPASSTSQSDAGFLTGVRYLVTTPGLPPLVLLKSGIACTSGAVPLLTVFGNRVLSDTPAPWLVGLLFAGRGAGAAVGSLFGRRVFGESSHQLQRTSLVGLAVIAVGYLALGTATTLTTCLIAASVAGAGTALTFVSSSVLLQKEVAPAFLGRAFSLDFGLMTVVGSVVIIGSTSLIDAGVLSARGGMIAAGLLALPPLAVLGAWLAAARRAPRETSAAPVTGGRTPGEDGAEPRDSGR